MQFIHSISTVSSRAVYILSLPAFATLGALSSGAVSVKFEAESGALGTDFAKATGGFVQYLATSTAKINNGNAGNSNRMVTCTVSFPATDTYPPYARVRVGFDIFINDSRFCAAGFGVKSPSIDSNWVTVNGLGTAGYGNTKAVVTCTNANEFVCF